ncbi:cytochrome c biogenesis protein DipZ [Candidatus Gottesmanbacteria bacterium]|nr:cytochrome c biogenesis protein DipZ [Candidatus Gottesmanbacteria bacterium]
MIVLLIFAFISGLVTILAPCIWPLLPIILSSSTTGGKAKSLGITLGIMLSFAIFTLTISYLVSLFGFDPDILRLLAVIIIGLLGLTLVIPRFSAILEVFVSRISGKFVSTSPNSRTGFWGGLITGASLGIVWSPCAGPILATIATLAATKAVNLELVLVTLVYVTGVGIPLFFFSYGGSLLLTKTRVLSPYTGKIQQFFGIIMILTALAIFTNYDKVLQVKLLDAFPSYTNFLVKLESNNTVKKQLDILKGGKDTSDMQGKPLNQVSEMGEKTLPRLSRAPEFVGIFKWLNVDKPLTMKELKGKVVLIDFWTYTCINCIRTLPHVTGWFEKYKDKGLVIVGVHTPEFEFEKKTENVEGALKQYKIGYPVAQDNDYETWNAYNNRYWPAKYLIDKDGYIRYTHFGEGEYDVTEQNIQILLNEAGSSVTEELEEMPDETPRTRISPEMYLGSSRMSNFYPNGNVANGRQTFTLSQNISQDTFSLGGEWTIDDEYSMAGKNAVLELNFSANKLFLVMRPPTVKTLVKLKVSVDGKLADDLNAGIDVQNGIVTIESDRLYNLVDLNRKTENHLLRLEFDPGISVYAFTFG